MRRKFNKTIAIIVAAGLIAGSINPMPVSAVEEQSNEETLTVSDVSSEDLYVEKGSEVQCVVISEDEDAIEEALEEAVDTSDYEMIEETDNSATVMLSETEMEALSEAEGVIVEPDILLEAMKSKKNQKNNQKENTQTTEKEAIETVVEDQWNITAVGADCDTTGENDTIKVAVIDSGRDYGEDINIAESIDLVDPESPDSGLDMTGHGTAIAGIIGAVDNEIGTTGVAEGTAIYSVRVLDENNQAPLSRIIEAVNWCINNDIDIINMSFGTGYNSAALQTVIKEAEEAGILMISSGGNVTTGNESVKYPAAYEEVVAVGSVNSQCRASSETILGSEIDLMAPGENVPLNSYYDSVTIGTGSSYAAAHVTAVAARLWSMDSSKDADFIRSLMNASAVALEEDGTGYGLADLSYAKQIYTTFESEYTGEDTIGSSVSDNSVSDNSASDNGISGSNHDITTYEMPAYVEANWNGTGHKHLVTAGSTEASLTSAELKLLKEASIWSDSNLQSDNFTKTSEYKNYMEEYRIFHAGGYSNYVAVTKYLYNVAVRIKNGVSIANACKATKYEPTNVDSNRANGQKTVMTIAVKQICNATLNGQSDVKNTANRNGLKVLGLALHVAGDAYAHKSIVTSDEALWKKINAEIKGFYTSQQINELKKDISKNKVTFSGISKYGPERTKETESKIKTIHGNLADKTDVNPQRYSRGAKWATTKLITWYSASNDSDRKYFTAEAFYPNMTNRSYYRYQQFKLVTYLKNTYNGTLPKLGNNISTADWQALSARD